MTKTLRRLRRTLTSVTVTVATLTAAATVPTAAQNGADEFRVGLYGYGAYVAHRADFQTLPGVGCCGGGFETGDGFGYGEGFLLQAPIVPQVALQLRGGYSIIGGELSRSEHIGNALSGETVVDAYSEHRIAPSLEIIALEPLLSIRPFGIPLGINVGAEVGYVGTRDYVQDETLTTPSDATFLDGSRVRNRTEGAIPEASPLYLAAVGGLSYDIMLGDRLVLSPELSFHHQLNDVLEDSTWKAHTVRLGAALALRLPKPNAAETPIATDVLAAAVTATGVQEDGAESPIVQMRVEEFMSTRLRPLLNYVFFDDGSAEIPSRYNALDRSAARRFAIDQLHDRDVIATYHDMLNIVGRRMSDDPKATIRLVGTNSGEGADRGNTTVSRRRAEAVRNYLRDTWGIAESRMRIESRNLPEVASNTSDPDGIAENRRVEIIADRRSITEPVTTNDTLRVSDPPTIRFRTNVNSDAGVASWAIAATQSGRVLREFKGGGEVPGVVDWRLDRETTALPRSAQAVEYRLDVVDNRGRLTSTPMASIGVEQLTLQRKRAERIADREINRYGLILFDFDRAELGDANRSIVDIVKRKISKGSTVTITGHTDRMGDSEHNHALSRDRAMVVARALGVGYENARGLGESAQLYDNDLPEGRFYSRIVDVTVETPVQ